MANPNPPPKPHLRRRAKKRILMILGERNDCEMPKWINHEEGVAFLNRIDDSTVRALIEHAYSQIYLNRISPECDFDVLFFFQIMEAFLRDKEKLN
jgi:hypothetical protein